MDIGEDQIFSPHPETCNALGDYDGVIHSRICHEGVLPLTASIRREIGPCGNFGNFIARRARVRDDSRMAPQVELDLERSFDGALSHQSVYEQTSENLRHTESVQNDKVQKRDWTQMLEQKSRAPPAQATTSRHRLTRCQAASVSVITKSGRSGQSQTPEAMQ